MSQKGLARCTGLLSGLAKSHNCYLSLAPVLLQQAEYSPFHFLRIGSKRRRCLSSQAALPESQHEVSFPVPNSGRSQLGPLGHRAKQKQADRVRTANCHCLHMLMDETGILCRPPQLSCHEARCKSILDEVERPEEACPIRCRGGHTLATAKPIFQVRGQC